LHPNHDRYGGGVCRVRRFRHKEGPHIGGIVPGQAAQGFLPVPERHAPDGHFQAPGFHDCPCLDKGGPAVSHARSQLVAQGHHFGFQFAVGHGFNLLLLTFMFII
jgi:hypothetical protein